MATVLLVSNHAEATYDFGYSGTLMAQTFVVPAGYDRLDYMKLKLNKLGSPSGNVVLSIYATSGGVPTGSALASVTVAQSSISDGENTFNFTDLAVTAGSKYAIVFNGGGTSASSTSAWYCTHSNTYSGGDSFYKLSGGGWTSNGYDMWFEVYGYNSATAPTGVTTGAVSSITTTTADVAIDVTADGGSAITERGVAYSTTNSVPTIGDNKKTTTGTTGAGTVNLTGLSAGSHYYARAYATNAIGTTYGDVVEFDTTSTTATVTSGTATSVTSSTASASGNVTDDGGATVSERGIAYGTSANPTTAGTKVTSGSGEGAFSANLSGLTPNTLYHFRAYAVNENGTTYGADTTFTTLDLVKYWAQSFTAGATGTLTKVRLLVKLVSGTTGKLKLRIYTNGGSTVPTTLLQTLADVNVTNTSYAYVDVVTNVAVTSGTKYWLVIESIKDLTPVTGYAIEIGSNSAGGYANGEVKYAKSSAPTSWINTSYTTHDMAFYAHVQPTVTATYTATVKSKILHK